MLMAAPLGLAPGTCAASGRSGHSQHHRPDTAAALLGQPAVDVKRSTQRRTLVEPSPAATIGPCRPSGGWAGSPAGCEGSRAQRSLVLLVGMLGHPGWS